MDLENVEVENTEVVKSAEGTADAGAPPVLETLAYTPNTKFKVMGQEKAFDDFLTPVIKDAETEKKIRELYEKSHGLESVKGDREQLRAKLSEIEPTYKELTNHLGRAQKAIEIGDYDTLGESLGINEQTVLKWAHHLMMRNEMPEDQKRLHSQNRESQRRLEQLEAEREQWTQQQSSYAVERKEMELAGTMSRPDVAQAVQQYDSGMGYAGAFRDAVINYGKAMSVSGQDISAEAAVDGVLKQMRAINPSFGVIGQVNRNIVTPSNKATIPNIQGTGTSPIKQKVKSLDDLRKLARSYQEE